MSEADKQDPAMLGAPNLGDMFVAFARTRLGVIGDRPISETWGVFCRPLGEWLPGVSCPQACKDLARMLNAAFDLLAVDRAQASAGAISEAVAKSAANQVKADLYDFIRDWPLVPEVEEAVQFMTGASFDAAIARARAHALANGHKPADLATEYKSDAAAHRADDLMRSDLMAAGTGCGVVDTANFPEFQRTDPAVELGACRRYFEDARHDNPLRSYYSEAIAPQRARNEATSAMLRRVNAIPTEQERATAARIIRWHDQLDADINQDEPSLRAGRDILTREAIELLRGLVERSAS